MITLSDRHTPDALAGPTRALASYAAYAWYALATSDRAGYLKPTARLVYVAAAHHADHAEHSPAGYHGTTVADLVVLTGLSETTVRVAGRCLRTGNWLEANDGGAGYRMPAEATRFVQAARQHPTVRCADCGRDVPAREAHLRHRQYVCDPCQQTSHAAAAPPEGRR